MALSCTLVTFISFFFFKDPTNNICRTKRENLFTPSEFLAVPCMPLLSLVVYEAELCFSSFHFCISEDHPELVTDPDLPVFWDQVQAVSLFMPSPYHWSASIVLCVVIL